MSQAKPKARTKNVVKISTQQFRELFKAKNEKADAPDQQQPVQSRSRSQVKQLPATKNKTKSASVTTTPSPSPSPRGKRVAPKQANGAESDEDVRGSQTTVIASSSQHDLSDTPNDASQPAVDMVESKQPPNAAAKPRRVAGLPRKPPSQNKASVASDAASAAATAAVSGENGVKRKRAVAEAESPLKDQTPAFEPNPKKTRVTSQPEVQPMLGFDEDVVINSDPEPVSNPEPKPKPKPESKTPIDVGHDAQPEPKQTEPIQLVQPSVAEPKVLRKLDQEFLEQQSKKRTASKKAKDPKPEKAASATAATAEPRAQTSAKPSRSRATKISNTQTEKQRRRSKGKEVSTLTPSPSNLQRPSGASEKLKKSMSNGNAKQKKSKNVDPRSDDSDSGRDLADFVAPPTSEDEDFMPVDSNSSSSNSSGSGSDSDSSLGMERFSRSAHRRHGSRSHRSSHRHQKRHKHKSERRRSASRPSREFEEVLDAVSRLGREVKEQRVFLQWIGKKVDALDPDVSDSDLDSVRVHQKNKNKKGASAADSRNETFDNTLSEADVEELRQKVRASLVTRLGPWLTYDENDPESRKSFMRRKAWYLFHRKLAMENGGSCFIKYTPREDPNRAEIDRQVQEMKERAAEGIDRDLILQHVPAGKFDLDKSTFRFTLKEDYVDEVTRRVAKAIGDVVDHKVSKDEWHAFIKKKVDVSRRGSKANESKQQQQADNERDGEQEQDDHSVKSSACAESVGEERGDIPVEQQQQQQQQADARG